MRLRVDAAGWHGPIGQPVPFPVAMDDPYLEQSPLLAGLEVIGQQ